MIDINRRPVERSNHSFIKLKINMKIPQQQQRPSGTSSKLLAPMKGKKKINSTMALRYVKTVKPYMGFTTYFLEKQALLKLSFTQNLSDASKAVAAVVLESSELVSWG